MHTPSVAALLTVPLDCQLWTGERTHVLRDPLGLAKCIYHSIHFNLTYGASTYVASCQDLYGHNVTWTVSKDRLRKWTWKVFCWRNVQQAVLYVILKSHSYDFNIVHIYIYDFDIWLLWCIHISLTYIHFSNNLFDLCFSNIPFCCCYLWYGVPN